ncbi:MAG: hypothetical protein ACFFCD_15280 [Promethearchaeota archaeon]
MSKKTNILVALPITFSEFKFLCPECKAEYHIDKFGHLVHGKASDPFIHGPGEYKLLCKNPDCKEEIALKAIEVSG